MIIFDTDILSCFGKIQKMNLLRDVFNGEFLISQAVYDERVIKGKKNILKI